MSMLSIRNLCEKILGPILLSPKKRGEEKDAKVTIHRRIEVTVERETISVIVPGHRPASADQTASRESDEGDFEGSRLELSSPQLPGEAADSGRTEHSKTSRSE
jgi:hypothetical protein